MTQNIWIERPVMLRPFQGPPFLRIVSPGVLRDLGLMVGC
jgi:hypothetical protein